MYVCPILCSFWPLLFATISKLILSLKGPLLWSAVATFCWLFIHRSHNWRGLFFTVSPYPSSNRTCQTSLKKHGYCCSLTRQWVPCWILIGSFTDELLLFTKLSKGRSSPCICDVFCFQAQQDKLMQLVNISWATSLSGSFQSSFIAFLVNSSPCADQELEADLSFSSDLPVVLRMLRLLVYSLQSL